jgi:hypothetical protein
MIIIGFFSLLIAIAPLRRQGLILICHVDTPVNKNVDGIIQVKQEVCNPDN